MKFINLATAKNFYNVTQEAKIRNLNELKSDTAYIDAGYIYMYSDHLNSLNEDNEFIKKCVSFGKNFFDAAYAEYTDRIAKAEKREESVTKESKEVFCSKLYDLVVNCKDEKFTKTDEWRNLRKIVVLEKNNMEMLRIFDSLNAQAKRVNDEIKDYNISEENKNRFNKELNKIIMHGFTEYQYNENGEEIKTVHKFDIKNKKRSENIKEIEAAINKKNAEYTQHIKETVDKINAIDKDISKQTNEIDTLNKTIEKITSEEAFLKPYTDLLDTFDKHKELFQEILNTYSANDIKKGFSEIRENSSNIADKELNNRLKKVVDILNREFTTDNTELKNSVKMLLNMGNLQTFMNTFEDKVRKVQDKIRTDFSKGSYNKEIEEVAKPYRDRIAEHQNNIKQLGNELESLKKELSVVEKQQTLYKENITNIGKVSKLYSDIIFNKNQQDIIKERVSNMMIPKKLSADKVFSSQIKNILANSDKLKSSKHIDSKEYRLMTDAMKLVADFGNVKNKQEIFNKLGGEGDVTMEKAVDLLKLAASNYKVLKEEQIFTIGSAMRKERLSLAETLMCTANQYKHIKEAVAQHNNSLYLNPDLKKLPTNTSAEKKTSEMDSLTENEQEIQQPESKNEEPTLSK